jgi:hypothetical protein
MERRDVLATRGGLIQPMLLWGAYLLEGHFWPETGPDLVENETFRTTVLGYLLLRLRHYR